MANISFTSRGNGHPVVLLHGFPLNSKIWDDFAVGLSKTFQVFTPDLPGFGQSPPLKAGFSINDVATEILAWLEKQTIKRPVVVGHSLGGYVALAMANQRAELLQGLVLFHSTAYPDTDEKKENRNKVLDFINKNGVQAFTSNFIPPLFADQHHASIAAVRQIATTSSEEAVVGYTKAMRDRESRIDLLRVFPKPVMIITGEKDAGITVESVQKQASEGMNIDVCVLGHVAHMGMLEEPMITANLIRDFVLKSNRP
jgi:pimeloyl-ACP methyl ester carboxylesterase